MTMRCTLCGAQNPETARRCQLCDTVLSEGADDTELSIAQSGPIALETTDLSHTTIRWDRLAVLLLILAAVALPWFLMSDLFVLPADVEASRQSFAVAKENYFANREAWDKQKDQVLAALARHERDRDPGKPAVHIDELPLEVVIAYLADELELIKEGEQEFSLYPASRGDEPLLILSKVDERLWPLKIPVTLDILLDSDVDRLEVKFVRLRRGERLENSELAWSYFGPELQSFRRMEGLSGGIRKLLLYEKKQKDPSQSGICASWEYQHYPMNAG